MKNLISLFAIVLFVISCNSGHNSRTGNARPVKLEFLEVYTKLEISNAWTKAADWVLHNDSILQKHNLQPIDLNILVEANYGSIGSANQNHMSIIMATLEIPEVKALFPKDLKFEWAMTPETEGEAQYRYLLYAVKIPKNKHNLITGKHIESAEAVINQYTGSPVITLAMNSQGQRLWATMTKNNIGKCIAITIDDRVVSCPLVQMAIKDGNTQISGNFTEAEAQDLAMGINAGK